MYENEENELDTDKLNDDNRLDTASDETLSEVEAVRRMGVAYGQKRGVYIGILIGLIIAFVVIVVSSLIMRHFGVISSGSDTGSVVSDGEDVYGNELLDEDEINKLSILYNYLDKYYYEDIEIDDLKEGILSGLLEGTGDDYTVYYTAEEYKAIEQSTEGEYDGIGAVLHQDSSSGRISVVKVYEDSPAQEAGLKAGDIILQVDDYDLSDMDLSEAISYIKGDANTTVTIIAKRSGKKMTFEIERREIEIEQVEQFMLNDQIGYLSISEFSKSTTSQYEEAMDALEEEGAKAVVFDLRDNPGGTVSSVTAILDDILPKGVIVYTEDKNGNREEATSDNKTKLDMPIAVLINSASASASEIFAGAIRDFDYGTLIGTTSYGKGIVQSIIPLSDGSAIKITTAKYYTPSGDYIHGKGIDPDIELEYEYTGDEDNYEYDKDNQVNKAIEVLEEELKEKS